MDMCVTRTVRWLRCCLEGEDWTLCADRRKQVYGPMDMSVFFLCFLQFFYCNYMDESHCKAISLQCLFSLTFSLPLSLSPSL